MSFVRLCCNLWPFISIILQFFEFAGQPFWKFSADITMQGAELQSCATFHMKPT